MPDFKEPIRPEFRRDSSAVTAQDEAIDPLTELLRHGARDLIERTTAEEFAVFLQQHADRCDVFARAAAIRNGNLHLVGAKFIDGVHWPPRVHPEKNIQGGAA
jgi:hypothetical protein